MLKGPCLFLNKEEYLQTINVLFRLDPVIDDGLLRIGCRLEGA